MKKISSFILTLVLCASIATISSYAFNIPSNSESCTLSSNETHSYSGYVIGTWKYYGAQCYSNSKHSIVAAAQYFDGSSNKYVTDIKESLEPYSNFMDHKTNTFNGPLAWRVYLRPVVPYVDGCSGRGYIRDK